MVLLNTITIEFIQFEEMDLREVIFSEIVVNSIQEMKIIQLTCF